MVMQDVIKQHLEIQSREFSRVLTMNLGAIETTLEKLREGYMVKWPMTPVMNKFIEEQKKLLVKYAEKDEKGEILIDGETQRPIIKQQKSYDTGLRVARSKYGDGEKQLIQRNQAWFDTMEEDIEIEFAIIKKEKHLPKSISGKERMALAFMLSKKLSGCL